MASGLLFQTWGVQALDAVGKIGHFLSEGEVMHTVSDVGATSASTTITKEAMAVELWTGNAEPRLGRSSKEKPG